MPAPATTPKPPYYAVIFTSVRTEDDNGYGEIARHMVELAAAQPGFLGIESARQELGITVSYWSNPEVIKAWKDNVDHRLAQSRAVPRIGMRNSGFGFVAWSASMVFDIRPETIQ